MGRAQEGTCHNPFTCSGAYHLVVIHTQAPTAWTGHQWGDVFRRVAFLWVTTTPKATLQAALGPKGDRSHREREERKKEFASGSQTNFLSFFYLSFYFSLTPSFFWLSTTVQKTFEGAGPSYAGPATFVAPSAAVAILYTATIGSLLTLVPSSSRARAGIR